jgi:hypothetical protein
MANPTSNFNWQMPTPTDLVTDLPADFEVFGQAVDSSMADLLGGTTGQILAKNSNTNMDFVWIANDQGDITGITASSPLTGGGTSGAVTVGIQDGTTTQKGAVQLENSTSSTSTTTAAVPSSVKSAYDLADGAIAKTTLTTAGDVIYRNATVPTRLGIGTAGQVLTVNSGATAPEWATVSAGGMTLISTTTLSGASVTLSSIPSGYVNLVLTVKKATNSTADGYFAIEPNALGATGYNWVTGVYDGTAYAGNSTRVRTLTTQLRTNDANALTTTFYNHEQLDWTAFSMDGGYLNGDYHALNNAGYCYIPTSAITSLKILNTGGNWAGGTAYLYGVK